MKIIFLLSIFISNVQPIADAANLSKEKKECQISGYKKVILIRKKGLDRHLYYKAYLKNLLLEKCYQVVNSKNEKYNFSIDLFLNWRKKKAMKKNMMSYNFSIAVYTYTLTNSKIGFITSDLDVTGDNFKQCYEQAKFAFAKLIIKEFSKLNLN